MNKTKLITDFVCIATSGATVDGREIKAQDLIDIAETYNKEVYTSLIWIEHYRFHNFGCVEEVKAVEKNGVVKLYAKLSPNSDFLSINERGQKLFTSIEITPNFAQTGKAYLTGLAITDSPASTGTTQIMFNRTGSDKNELIVGDHVEIDLSQLFSEEKEEKGLITKFFNWLKTHGDTEQNYLEEESPHFSIEDLTIFANSGKQKTQQGKAMNKEDFSKMLAEAVAEGVSQAFKQQAQATQEQQEKQNTQSQETVSVEEFNKLKQNFETLQENFTKATQTNTSRVPNNIGNFEGESLYSIQDNTGF